MPAGLDPNWLVPIAVAFLAGSVPFSLLIGLAKGVDIRTIGSKNVGATNLGRALGSRYFFLGFSLDLLKGLLPTLGAGLWMETVGTFSLPPEQAWPWLAVMAAAVLGHMYSPWVGFKGGKGVATGLGAMLGIFPATAVPAVGSLVVFLVVFGLWRFISAASVAAACTLPVWVWLAFGFARRMARERAMDEAPPQTAQAAQALRAQVEASIDPWPFTITAAALAALVVWRHLPNLRRLAAGEELRFGPPPKSGG